MCTADVTACFCLHFLLHLVGYTNSKLNYTSMYVNGNIRDDKRPAEPRLKAAFL